jgi:hypothetical protein
MNFYIWTQKQIEALQMGVSNKACAIFEFTLTSMFTLPEHVYEVYEKSNYKNEYFPTM